ncbi:hypothetical protein OJ997_29040 [Solirubrobacter phytolaccae]|uniref:Uncharacterized protein n=1 Tax=Solirubrobacter phytolaccae TaxID=1404360 RepID=A0A9X3SE22_9ACTN|nr:hypothetical protein [Solirubrobacter phytolaccae]MDA0184385.1 hypothetical protein [Solirubrobacter phytolaccae]
MSWSDSSSPLSGEALLDAVTDAIVALHLREYGTFPATAETVLLGDDLLACTRGGVHADPGDPWIEFERTAASNGRGETVQTSPHHTYVDVVQRLSGRTVLAFVCNHAAGPDVWVDLFWLTT